MANTNDLKLNRETQTQKSEFSLKEAEKQAIKSNLDLKSFEFTKDSLLQEKSSHTATFFPEFDIKTGYSKRKKLSLEDSTLMEGYKYGMFAYGQLHWSLFNGGINFRQRIKIDKEMESNRLMYEIEKNKWLLKLRQTLSQQYLLNQHLSILHQSHMEHEQHIQWLKKKVRSGLSLDLELVRFDLDSDKMKLEEKKLQELIFKNKTELETILLSKFAPNNLDEILTENTFDSEFKKINWNQIQQKPLEQSWMEQNIDIQIVEADLEIRNVYPKMDLDYKYGAIESGESKNISSIQNRIQDHELQLTLTIPIWDGGVQTSKHNALLSKKTASEYKLFYWQQSKSQELMAQKDKLQNRINQVDILKSAESKSKLLYNKTKQAFQLGLKDGNELMDAYIEWSEIQKNLISTKKEMFDIASEIELTYYYPGL